MPLDKGRLSGFLEVLDKELKRKITLVAAGGTAMTLLDLKPSTIDIDFIVPSEHAQEFKQALSNVSHGFRIYCWEDGMVFSQILPKDYVKKSIAMKTKTKNIELKALHPLDIVVTKIGRLDARDIQDIEACIRRFKLTKNQITRRASKIQYVGREENYQINLQHVIKRFFKKMTAYR